MEDLVAEESLETKFDFGLRGDSNKYLRASVKMLRDFQQINGYELYQRERVEEANILFATVGSFVVSSTLGSFGLFGRFTMLMAKEKI
jgi:hypothetical protein